MTISVRKLRYLMKEAGEGKVVCIECSEPKAVYWGYNNGRDRCTCCRGPLSSEAQICGLITKGSLIIMENTGLMYFQCRLAYDRGIS